MWRKGGRKPLGGERKGAEEEGWEEVWRDSALLTAVEVVLRPISRKVEQNPSEHHSQASASSFHSSGSVPVAGSGTRHDPLPAGAPCLLAQS